MRFTVDVMPASPEGGVWIYLDGVRLGPWAVPVNGFAAVAEEMGRRHGDACEANHHHLTGESCDICDGAGTDYLGRPCHRLIASR